MNNTKIIALATIAATIVPAITITAYFMAMIMVAMITGTTNGAEYKILPLSLIYGLLISGAHVVFIGLPIIWLLNKLKKLNIFSIIIFGFIAGCTPMSIWSWPIDYTYSTGSSYWDGKETVIAKIDGMPTLVGWIDYIQGAAFMGIFGLISALSFWWVWKQKSPYKTIIKDI